MNKFVNYWKIRQYIKAHNELLETMRTDPEFSGSEAHQIIESKTPDAIELIRLAAWLGLISEKQRTKLLHLLRA